jgi:hypothetical protein
MLHYSRYFSLIGLVFPIAIVITLLLTHRPFYEAADRASLLTRNSPPASPL